MLFVQWAGLVAGPLIAVLVYLLLGPAESSALGQEAGGKAASDAANAVLSEPGRRTLAIAAWMATWWITEALPVSVTALVPLVLLPSLGATTMKAAAAPFGDEIIFLFLGGFIIGIAMERSGLHRRIALATLAVVGTRPTMMVAGVMATTAFMSMWVSNTATTIMMLPIVTSVVAMTEKLRADKSDSRAWTAQDVERFSLCMLLGIAYAASIGGLGTPIGTPPNGVLIQSAQQLLGKQIAFADWMKIGVPLVLILLPAAWLLLTRVLYPVRGERIEGGRELIRTEREKLGRVSRAEWIVLGVFLFAVAWWLFRVPLCYWLGLVSTNAAGEIVPRVTDATVAIAAAVLLFVIPVNVRERRFVITWEDAEKLPWGVLLLFGGGLSLAAAMSATGCDKYLGSLFGSLAGMPMLLVLAVLVVGVIALSELASNTAIAAALMPVLAAVGPAMGIDPMLLMTTAALAATCGFMLPVATPPNAIVFATGKIGIPRMMRAGILLDVVCAVVIIAFMWLLGPWLLEMVVK
jgi:sodium-dependent dicarboxylate transporter 2/3/5